MQMSAAVRYSSMTPIACSRNNLSLPTLVLFPSHACCEASTYLTLCLTYPKISRDCRARFGDTKAFDPGHGGAVSQWIVFGTFGWPFWYLALHQKYASKNTYNISATTLIRMS